MIFNINSTRGQTRLLTCVARVTCLVRNKRSTKLGVTAETQGLSSKVQSQVHSIGTTEPMRPGGTSAQTSRFLSIA